MNVHRYTNAPYAPIKAVVSFFGNAESAVGNRIVEIETEDRLHAVETEALPCFNADERYRHSRMVPKHHAVFFRVN